MATNVFEEGDIHWEKVNVDSSPKPLLVLSPTVAGAYPVILFFHGFCIQNTSYSKLLAHIASHGFILVAPDLLLPPILGFIPNLMSGPEEVKCAEKIVNWIVDGLQPFLPNNVKAQLESLVLAGHSRGGKTAFSVALGCCRIKTNLKFKVLLGIDPVAGRSEMSEEEPCILTNEPKSFNLGMPILVIGTGLGHKPNGFPLMPPCAPDGVNHEEFYKKCKAPCAHFVTKEYGHMDMLDDEIPGFWGFIKSKCICKNGEGPRDLMRKTVAGLVVAFLRAHLKTQFEDLDITVDNPDLAPTKLVEVEYVRE